MRTRAGFTSKIHPEFYMWLRPFAVASLAAFLLLSSLILLVEAYKAEDSLSPREKQVSLQFETLRQNPEELRAFFLARPKGGDIHAHLTGTAYAEHLIDQASAEGLCVSLNNYTVSRNYCGSDNSEPIRNAYSNPKLYGQIVDAWSMKDSNLPGESNHDHFFNSFAAFGGATTNASSLVADIRSSAFRENVTYLEIIKGVDSGAANLGSKVGWDDNLTRFYNKLVDNGLDSVAQNLSGYINDTDIGSLRILKNRSDPGGNVTNRYLLAGSRTQPKEKVFGQLAAAFYVANLSSLVVGVNLHGSEDDWTSRENYSLHMRMVGFFHSMYPKVNIALHAGELNLGLVPTDDLRFHIKEAVEVAHASRIGHGVDIMWELNSDQILKEMARNKTVIEIMPVSNQIVLGVRGKDHPLPIYFDRGVPIVLASDDAGLLRTDLSEQYVVIASEYPQIKYGDFKKFVRNSIEYSFLQGRGIWASKGDYSKLVAECSGCSPESKNPSAKCKAFLDSSEKARMEWKLEGDLAAFEEKYANGKSSAKGCAMAPTRIQAEISKEHARILQKPESQPIS